MNVVFFSAIRFVRTMIKFKDVFVYVSMVAQTSARSDEYLAAPCIDKKHPRFGGGLEKFDKITSEL